MWISRSDKHQPMKTLNLNSKIIKSIQWWQCQELIHQLMWNYVIFFFKHHNEGERRGQGWIKADDSLWRPLKGAGKNEKKKVIMNQLNNVFTIEFGKHSSNGGIRMTGVFMFLCVPDFATSLPVFLFVRTALCSFTSLPARLFLQFPPGINVSLSFLTVSPALVKCPAFLCFAGPSSFCWLGFSPEFFVALSPVLPFCSSPSAFWVLFCFVDVSSSKWSPHPALRSHKAKSDNCNATQSCEFHL